MKLIILSAGRGTRFGPLTKKTPKGMILVAGKPLLEHVVRPYLAHVSDIVFVVNSDLGMKIKKHFGKNYLGHKVFYKIQAEQKGTMDALMACKDIIKENEIFCVVNGDDLLKESDIKKAIASGQIGCGVSRKIMPKGYLGVQVDGKNILGFMRHAKKSNSGKNKVKDLFYNGFNILDDKVFRFHPMLTLDGELGLPHTLFANLDIYPLKAFNFDEWETVNTPLDLPAAEKFLKNL